MKIKNIMLFSYDFPHKKTQDFIFRLLVENYNINYIIATPWKRLPIKSSSLYLFPQHSGLIHPKIICKRFNIKYFKLEHNSPKTIDILWRNPVDLAIISGARILDKEIIIAAGGKVLNIHPGLLPEVRGLDTLPWSIYYDAPIGISAHFVGKKIDSGRLIYKEKLKIKPNDNIMTISLRLLEQQSNNLIKSLAILKKSKLAKFKNLDLVKSPYNTKMPQVLEKKTIAKFSLWVKKYASN